MENLSDLTKKVVEFRDVRDWKQFHNPKDCAISLSLEASEVLEHFQWKNKEEMEKHVTDHLEDISEELADVLYWVLLMSNDLGVDLVSAFNKKLQTNGKKYPVEKSLGKHTRYNEL